MFPNETKIHGTIEFPMELYMVDSNHPRYNMSFHWHTNAEIIRVLSGKLTVSLNNREFEAKKGDILFVNPEVIHGAYPKNCIYECIVYNPRITPPLTVDGESFTENLANGLIHINEKLPSDDKELSDCIEKLFVSLRETDAPMRYVAIGMLYNMYGIIMNKSYYTKNDENVSISRSSMIKLKNALTFIRSSFNTEITLDDMANHAGMSKKYFCTFFKQYTHTTPFDYLIAYRIERASHYLLTTDMDITAISYSCGFNDLSYFIKTFKNIKGVTPGRFRNSFK